MRPSLVLTEAQLSDVVDDLMAHDAFVVDVETIGGLNTLRNEVAWIAFATEAAVHVIPLRHPNGEMVTAACSRKEYDPSTRRPLKRDPSKLTKGKTRMVHHPATFAPPPKQLRPDKVFEALRPVFWSDRLIINHNLRYDLKSMAKYWGDLPPGPYADTQVMVHLCNENLPQKGLKPVTRSWYLGRAANDHKTAQRFYPELGKAGVENFSLSEAARYCVQDVTFTRRLYHRCLAQIEDEGMTGAWELDMQLYGVLMRMEHAGIEVNIEQVAELREYLAGEISRIETDAARIAGVRFALTNPNEKRKYLFGDGEAHQYVDGNGRRRFKWVVPEGAEKGQGITPAVFTPTGKPRLKAEDLEKLAETNELAALFQTHGELDKLRAAFVEPFLSGELIDGGRVRTSFHLARTDTGRLSSSDPNLQQIPVRSQLGREFRKCFTAPPGYDLIVADYSQIELRVVAHVAQDPEMIRILSTGEDIHRAATAGALQKDPEDVTDEERSMVGKVVNFLIVYGGGAKTLQKTVKRPLEECEEIIANYFKTFKRLEPMKARIIKEAVARGDRERPMLRPPYVVIPPTGRRRRLPGLFSSDKYEVFKAQRQAVNAVVQGFAANIMKMALVEVDRVLTEADLGARLLLTVHDEIVMEAPSNHAEEVYPLVIDAMNGITLPDGTPILGQVPLLAEGGIGKTWVEAK